VLADGIFLREELIEHLPLIPSDALRVLLVLMDRHRVQETTRNGLTLTELARATDLGLESVGRSLLWLQTPQVKSHPTKENEIVPFIHMEAKSKHFTLRVDAFWIDANLHKPIPFTFDNTDSTKLATLEKEIRRLSTLRSSSSGLTAVLRGEEQQLVGEIERDLGRGVTIPEAWLLGKSVQGFNPSRVKTLWRQKHALSKDPIRAIYAMLTRGKLGQGAKQSEGTIDRVVYKEL
jgi:hypothetical protein